MTVFAVRKTRFLVAAALIAGLAACGSVTTDANAPFPTADDDDQIRNPYGHSVVGPDGLTFGGAKRRSRGTGDDGAVGIGVNAWLWRASLDTLAFMPIAQADPFGGVILTDWHSPQGNPNERFKANLLIVDRQLRADGVQISLFRQVRDATGAWVDAPVDPRSATGMEDAILTRARQLRLSQTGAS